MLFVYLKAILSILCLFKSHLIYSLSIKKPSYLFFVYLKAILSFLFFNESVLVNPIRLLIPVFCLPIYLCMYVVSMSIITLSTVSGLTPVSGYLSVRGKGE